MSWDITILSWSPVIFSFALNLLMLHSLLISICLYYHTYPPILYLPQNITLPLLSCIVLIQWSIFDCQYRSVWIRLGNQITANMWVLHHTREWLYLSIITHYSSVGMHISTCIFQPNLLQVLAGTENMIGNTESTPLSFKTG